ncbi:MULTISPECIES: tripartite tricarboxylate transporter TctB family protein [Paracoccus]|uniref:tripartite tricarboxylate transporter TctB family protein n=1 Tax=Paracoccus TaxID=265 RepID=UPI0004B5C677|nr:MULTISPECIES: tripartite tricarboxylate transporter TctB family protein [Paracoccus]
MVVVASAFLLAGQELPHGTAAAMGPGYFPRWIAGVLGVIGAILVLRSLRQSGSALPAIRLLPLLLVLAAIVFFGVAAERLGLVLTAFGSVVIAGLASRRRTWWSLPLLAAALSAFSALIFVKLLNLALPLWPSF